MTSEIIGDAFYLPGGASGRHRISRISAPERDFVIWEFSKSL